TQQIQGLPISGRLFTDFALLTPGVTTGRTSVGSTITEFEVTRVSFAGMRDLSNQVRHPPQSGWLDELGRLKGGWRLLPGFPQSAPWFQSVSSYLPTWSGTSKPLPKTH